MEVDFKLSGLDRLMLALDAKLTKQVVNRTLNDLATRGVNAGKKEVLKKYNIKSKKLSSYIKATKSNPNNLKAFINVKARHVSLFNFINSGNIKSSIKAKRRGRKLVKVKIIKGSSDHEFKHAFLMIGASKNIGIFENVRGVKTSEGKNKIRRLSTVGPTNMFQTEGVPVMEEYINKNSARIFKTNFNYYIDKKIK